MNEPPLDGGSEAFQPSNLEITAVDTGNAATNVIAGRVTLAFNVRFNDRWSPEALRAELLRRIEAALGGAPYEISPGASRCRTSS